MRVVSALISSLIFSSAVLKHPKLFAQAQNNRFIRDWAGAQKFAPSHERPFDFLTATFVVPEAFDSGAPDQAAFVGITFGAEHCNNLAVCISLGVLITITSAGIKYEPAYQVFPGAITTIQETDEGEEFQIVPEDIVRATIDVLDEAPTLLTLHNLGRQRDLVVDVQLLPGLALSNRIVEWKVGAIRTQGPLGNNFNPLPGFGLVIFSQAYVVREGEIIDSIQILPVRDGSTFREVWDGYILMLQPRVNNHDAYRLEIDQPTI